jgi:hypothetical protein
MNGKWLIGLFVSVFACSAMAGDAPQDLYLAHAWRVRIGVDGKVLNLADAGTGGKLSAAVRESVERAIRGWSFVPGTVNGKPAATETTVTVNMTLAPSAENTHEVCLKDASTGGSLDAFSVGAMRPWFPQELKDSLNRRHAGFVGRVVVKADYDAQGRILDVTPQPDMSLNAKPGLVASADIVVRKLKIWPERVDGHGVAASVFVPLCYAYDNWNKLTRQSWEQACPWIGAPPGAGFAIDSVRVHAAYTIDPVAKLASNAGGGTCHPVSG